MGANPLVPDLAATDKVVRKRRAPKHDFKDGFGKVFAHRHDNGGGWVADTAYVGPGCRVTRNAEVFGYAKVYDSCDITGCSKVYGRARLFDAVSLSQRARIHGNALVTGSAQVHDNVIIYGAAQVSGMTRLNGKIHVHGNAKVFDTYANGPVRRGDLVISGDAIVDDSRLYGYCAIQDEAYVKNSSVHNAMIESNAKLIGSNVSSDFVWQQNAFLAREDGNNGSYASRPESEVLIELSNYRLAVRGTLINTVFTGTRLVLRQNITMIGSRVMLRYTNRTLQQANPAVEFFDALGESTPLVFLSLENANYVEDLERYLGAAANPPPPRPVTAPGYVPTQGQAPPNLEIIRQRRLMRLEGENA